MTQPSQPFFLDADHLERMRSFSQATWGPGPRTVGLLQHIRSELNEIEADPTDIEEWIDVIILAIDGAWRAGWEPQEILDTLLAKQNKNESRTWPDWREFSQDEPIEHDRTRDEVRA